MGPRIAFCQGSLTGRRGDVSGVDERAGPAGVSCRGNEHARPGGCSGWTARRYARCCRSIGDRRGITAASRHGGRTGSITGIIDRLLDRRSASHHKQRHTAKRIFDRLRDEYGFTGGYTIVKDYVRERRLRSREMFVPLVHSPGHAQADFGEAMAVIGGVARNVNFLAFDLPRELARRPVHRWVCRSSIAPLDDHDGTAQRQRSPSE